jgi:hypothetical protein
MVRARMDELTVVDLPESTWLLMMLDIGVVGRSKVRRCNVPDNDHVDVSLLLLTMGSLASRSHQVQRRYARLRLTPCWRFWLEFW